MDLRIGTANLVVVRLGNRRRDISQGVTFVMFWGPAPISSRFLCPRPPLLLCNRHATQARPTVLAKTVGLVPRPSNTYLKD